MICPSCQANNRELAKFCDNCGTPLQVKCPNCDAPNRPAAKFCDNCGQALKPGGRQPSAAAPQPSVLDQLIPPDLATKLEAARHSGTMEGERRVVTMLFCDVVGSTAASEQLDPEEWIEIINGAFDHMITPVYRYEGTVARLMGDAILAFFGAPIAHEDDPQRAVLAGLDIVQSIQRYRSDVLSEWGIELNVRVGINTGPVVVGAVGSDLRLEYTAMGDAINLAARMEQTADPGTVQIAANTHRLVAPLFEFEDLGGIEVKGKVEPVQSFRVIGRKASPGRLRGIQGLESPLIGREREKAQLDQAIAGLDRGHGGIIFVVGEAGLGKSRLIGELQQSAASLRPPTPSPQWLSTASLSFETEQPYALFRRLFRRLVGAKADEAQELLREKLDTVIVDLPAEEQEGFRQVIDSLFGLKNQEGKPSLEGEAFKGRLYTTMISLWSTWAKRRPLVLVCDDLHWTDPASVALLQHLLPLTGQVPLLLLFAQRPEPEAPGWGLKDVARKELRPRFTEIVLQPLSYERSGLLVDSLLQVAELPQRLRERILEKSEGNPFFVEEVVRSLIDQGIIVLDERGGSWQASGEGQEIDIPDNLQSLLVARIDRLAEDTRRILQMASVVGRSFYYRVLARVVALAKELDRHLSTLQETDLIREVASIPELEYVFRHALTQEAAYSTILLKQRRLFHRQVGEALETLFPEQIEELAGELADHFYRARDYERALPYYTMAADRAFRLHASAEAIAHYTGAIACSQRVEVTSEQLVHLYVRRGRAFELNAQFDQALHNYQEMIELAGQRGDESLKLASLTAQCIVRATQTPLYDPALARELGGEALVLAKNLDDQEAEAKVLWGFLLVEFWGGGDNRQALEYGQRSLHIARNLELKEQMAYTLTNLVNVHLMRDEMAAAQEAGQEARELWRQLGNTPMLADGHNNALWIELFLGNFDTAIAMGREGRRLSQSIGGVWGQAGALNSIAAVELEKGDIAQAVDSLSEARRLATEADMPPLVYFGLPYLVLAYLSAGALERADRLADQLYDVRDLLIQVYRPMSLAVCAQVKIRLGQLPLAQRILAEAFDGLDLDGSLFQLARALLSDAYLQLALTKPERALERMEFLTVRMRRAGVRRNLPEGLWLQGKALLALNKPDLAMTAFLEAQQVAEQTGERPTLWQILWELSQLETATGNPSPADSYRRQAQEVISYIADHTGTEEFRRSFQALPEVRAALGY